MEICQSAKRSWGTGSCEPPITKEHPTRRQVLSAKAGKSKPQPSKDNPPTKAVNSDQCVSTRIFVVHGIPCRGPIAERIQDVKQTGIAGAVEARWLVGGQRGADKSLPHLLLSEVFRYVFMRRMVRHG